MTSDDVAAWHAPGVLLGALAIDLCFGEYPNRLHPVVWVGAAISWMDARSPKTRALAQLAYGAVLALTLPAAFAAIAWGLVHRLSAWPVLAVGAEILLLKGTFAVRALGRAAFRVEDALARGALDDARDGLRSLCSREPWRLSSSELVAATVESVAENASDSFVAPLFFFALFGVPGAVAYRVVNTLDAMIGYHGKYEYLGKASARLDDLLNFVPARITACLFVVVGACVGADAPRAVRTWRRDAAATESPNAGRPMATMAGLLGVALAKDGHYHLGDAVEPLALDKVRDAWRIVAASAGLAAALTAVALGLGHAHSG